MTWQRLVLKNKYILHISYYIYHSKSFQNTSNLNSATVSQKIKNTNKTKNKTKTSKQKRQQKNKAKQNKKRKEK